MATIFKRNDKGPWIIQFFDAEGRRRERSTRTTDFRAAERIAAKLGADVALRRDGVVDARQDRFAQENRKPLASHVSDYAEHCRHIALAPQSVAERTMHLDWLLRQTGATRLSDLTLDAVERALASLRAAGRSARTINHRRSSVLAFANWCVRTGRMESNPLARLAKLDESRDRRRIRRPLSDEELTRLMAVAEERGRKTWYLAAVLAGLRRSDLMRLTWGDVDLEDAVLTIRDGKAKREDRLPIHSELLEELRRIRPATVLPKARVFPCAVTNRTRQEDFKRAKISLDADEQGRVVDLHALRGTLGTRIAREGIAPQVAQRLMRHSDYRLTLKHYTVLSLSDAAAAMDRLPGIAKPEVAQATGTLGGGADDPQQIPQQSAHETARDGATSRNASASAQPSPNGRNDLPPAKLRDETRPTARACDGAPARTRTWDRRIRNPMLCPAELRALSEGSVVPAAAARQGRAPRTSPWAQGEPRGGALGHERSQRGLHEMAAASSAHHPRDDATVRAASASARAALAPAASCNPRSVDAP